MIVKLPYFGFPCCVPTPIVIKVKNPLILVENEERTEGLKHFVLGTIVQLEQLWEKGTYVIDLPDSLFVEGTPQLYTADFDKWSCDSVLIDYINENIVEGGGLTTVFTDDTLSGTGTSANPLSVDISVIDGRH